MTRTANRATRPWLGIGLAVAALAILPALRAQGAPVTDEAGRGRHTARALSAEEVPALLAPPARGVRVIAIWSLDCAYCEGNLAALRAYQRGHADVALVFVATDPVAQHPAIDARLARAQMDDVPSRAYADATPDRINFVLDPSWGGETPRTMIIHADGSRKSASGALNADRITGLIK